MVLNALGRSNALDGAIIAGLRYRRHGAVTRAVLMSRLHVRVRRRTITLVRNEVRLSVRTNAVRQLRERRRRQYDRVPCVDHVTDNERVDGLSSLLNAATRNYGLIIMAINRILVRVLRRFNVARVVGRKDVGLNENSVILPRRHLTVDRTLSLITIVVRIYRHRDRIVVVGGVHRLTLQRSTTERKELTK